MRKEFSIMVFTLGLSSFAPGVHAQGLFLGMMSEQTPSISAHHLQTRITKQQAKAMFRAMDLNGDGRLTKKEFLASYNDYFSDEDTDKFISERFRAIDKKNTGSVTRSEFIANRNAPVRGQDTLALAPQVR